MNANFRRAIVRVLAAELFVLALLGFVQARYSR
jgi:hypothetical protein